MVARETSGNMKRPPNRTVSAPTGIRPSDPTITGTATTRAWANGDRWSTYLNLGPWGDSSAHAQKFTAKPTVATASITQGRAPGPSWGRLTVSMLLLVSIRLLINASLSLDPAWFSQCCLLKSPPRDLCPAPAGPWDGSVWV